MIFEEQAIQEVFLICPKIIEDNRGVFFRSFCKREFEKITDTEFVQINHSINFKKGTLRGIHYQLPSFAEEKIIRCIQGSVFDVFVDLRKNSPTFLNWGSVILSAENKKSLFLPKGIAHGFLTLADDSQLLYQHSEFYTPDFEAGIRYDDPKLNIQWPTKPFGISERDKQHPFLTADFNGI